MLDMRYNKKIQWVLLLGLIMAGQASLQVCTQEKAEAMEIVKRGNEK